MMAEAFQMETVPTPDTINRWLDNRQLNNSPRELSSLSATLISGSRRIAKRKIKPDTAAQMKRTRRWVISDALVPQDLLDSLAETLAQSPWSA